MNIDVITTTDSNGNTRTTSLEYRAWMAIRACSAFVKPDRKRDLVKASHAYKLAMQHTRTRRRRYWLNAAISYANRAFDVAKIHKFEAWCKQTEQQRFNVVGLACDGESGCRFESVGMTNASAAQLTKHRAGMEAEGD